MDCYPEEFASTKKVILRVLKSPMFQCPECLARYEAMVTTPPPVTHDTVIKMTHPTMVNNQFGSVVAYKCENAGKSFTIEPEFLRLEVKEIT